MASQVSICNIALGNLGDKLISSLTESTKRAMYCNQFYDLVRDEVLKATKWKFAQKRVALALNTTDPLFGFEYSYMYPADCLQLHYLIDENDQKYAYAVEQKDIYTDCEEAYVKYTMKIVDPAKYPIGFVICMAFRLASFLAIPLTGDKKLRDSMRSEYGDMLLLHSDSDQAQGYSNPQAGADDDSWIKARTSSGTGSSDPWAASRTS